LSAVSVGLCDLQYSPSYRWQVGKPEVSAAQSVLLTLADLAPSAEGRTTSTVVPTECSDGHIPVSSDYDGNATTDLAVFRPSTGQWFVQSQTGRSWV
jgi:hypothetical protein